MKMIMSVSILCTRHNTDKPNTILTLYRFLLDRPSIPLGFFERDSDMISFHVEYIYEMGAIKLL